MNKISKVKVIKKKTVSKKKNSSIISYSDIAAKALKCSLSDICFLLRTCDKDLKARQGFQWPSSGLVSAPDWKSKPSCGNGLHGLLSGEGDGSLLNNDEDAKWLVIAAVKSEVVQINRKVKVPRAYVCFVGTKKEATDLIVSLCPGSACVYAMVTSGNYGHSTSGYGGHSTSGDYGHSTSGNGGHSTSGYGGHSTSGDYGHSTSGDRGSTSSGENGIVEWKYWDGKRNRIKTLYVGEPSSEALSGGEIKAWHVYYLNDRYEVEDKGHGPSMGIEAGMRSILADGLTI
jgi:hypothetical protein